MASTSPQSRADRIIDEVLRHGKLRVEDLVVRLQSSSATMRRDLAALHQKGLVRREHGVVYAPDPVVDGGFRSDSAFRDPDVPHEGSKAAHWY